MQNNKTRIYDFRPPGGGTPHSYNKLFIIGGIILLIFITSLTLQGTKSLITSVIENIFLIPIILISLTFHEYAHAAMANFLGDPTPRLMGRLSLNPLRHLDLVGTLLLFFAGFGWAKPVIVDPRNFRVPNRAMLSVALAGPTANIFLALTGYTLLKIMAISVVSLEFSQLAVILGVKFCQTLIIINLSLAMLNMLPIPPLDGSRIISYALPQKYRLQYRAFEQMAPMILLLLFALGGFGMILNPAITSTFTAINTMFGNPIHEINAYLLQLQSASSQLML